MPQHQRLRLFLLSSLACLVALLGGPTSSQAQETPVNLKDRPLQPNSVLDLNAEYRLRTVNITPLDLSGTEVTDTLWTEQRLRLDLGLTKVRLGGLTVQLDVLDGVLFGDNGEFGGSPSPNSGVSIATKRPNLSRWQVGLREGGNPVDPDSYVPVLAPAPPLEINFAYADIILPIGLLRIGRQPQAYGSVIASHDGSRVNRWGVSSFNDTADRILFGTALDAIYDVITREAGYVPELDVENGLFLAGYYDWINQGSPFSSEDNLNQAGGALQWRKRSADWFGLAWRDLLVSAFVVNLTDERFKTNIWALPTRSQGHFGPFYFEFQTTLLAGRSREISEGFSVLSGGEPSRQTIHGYGMHALLDYRIGPVTMTMQFDLASGDADPRASTPITSMSFARDRNVGLLLFEHILAFESARSVGVGIENLSSLDAASFPLTEVATESRFTNAIAAFPQVAFHLVEIPNNKLDLRIGGLFAWPEAAGGVVDPILTVLSEDGLRIDDDAVNFHGGAPGSFYGTEIDAKIVWEFRKTFIWEIEGAYLIPGSSLQDENGDAVNAYLLENRFTLLY